MRRVVRVGGGEHACGSGGGFGKRSATVQYGDFDTAMVEFEREGEADDSGASDADVGMGYDLSLDGSSRI